MASVRPRIFLDTSAVFAAVWSAADGARALLKLGEGALLRLVISQDVLAEIDDVVREKAPRKLADVALLLHAGHIEVSAKPSPRQIDMCREWVTYDQDAIVLAGALNAGVEFFVTLDRKHFLDNNKLRDAAPIAVGTPGDCLAWYRERLNAHP